MSQLSKFLKELRGDDSLYEVEKQTGIRRAQLLRYENGQRTPPRDILKRLSNYYEVAYEVLLHLYLDEHFSDPEEHVLVHRWATERLRGKQTEWVSLPVSPPPANTPQNPASPPAASGERCAGDEPEMPARS